MDVYILIVFILSCLFSFIFLRKPRFQIGIFILLGFILFIICITRNEINVRDYDAYLSMFRYKTDMVEVSFNLIRDFVIKYLSGDVFYLFFIYAIIGLVLKLYCIYKFSTNIILSLIIYLSYLYIVQDLTAIRIGAATSFVLLSLPHLVNRNLKKFLLCAILATIFHSSAFVVFFLWFLNSKYIKPGYYIAILILSYFIIPIVSQNLSLFQHYFPIYLQSKLLAYETFENTEINIFNVWQLARVILTIFFLLIASNLYKKNKYSILLVKIYFLATVTYVLLSFNPAFAGRISEIFMIADIILLPQLLLIANPKFKFITNIIVLLIAGSYLYLNLYYLKLIN
ncbi:EpsG family protein [uncultured Chryseobacterium sp.]|uniref:EpsG family protein n=1 Tax=uncultured Chryseobacterium sp. TaxID=259322 RepID=UPI0025CDCC1F|nr:EpsG family protein [uncultured Chryseobacterium sp.]